jgi:hypothetical protein
MFRTSRPLLLGLALVLALCRAAVAQTLGQPLGDEGGLTIPIPDGPTLNLRIVDHNLRIYALDGDGKLVLPPYAKAIVEVEYERASKNEHLMLRQRDGNPWLTHPRFLRPPYFYRLRILLYPYEDSDEGRIVLPVQELNQT